MNNNYPFNYLPNYQNNFGNNQPNNVTQDERIWVSSQQAAESYLVCANGFVRLWDSSQPRFYEKSADCTGRPMTMKIYEYKEVSPIQEMHSEEYVSTKEFAEFKDHVNEFINAFENKEVKKNAKQSSTTNATVQ